MSFDIENTEISQYANSPVIAGLVEDFAEWFLPTFNVIGFQNVVWDIATAQGFGLDIWGRILGVSRYIEVPGNYPIVAQDSDLLTTLGGSELITELSDSKIELSDADFLPLLYAKALANITQCSIPILNKLSQLVFGTGAIYVIDALNMTMQYVFVEPPPVINIAIVLNSGVFPHPTGVGMAAGYFLGLVTLAGTQIDTLSSSDLTTLLI